MSSPSVSPYFLPFPFPLQFVNLNITKELQHRTEATETVALRPVIASRPLDAVVQKELEQLVTVQE
jgi:hypothetical protein